MTDQYANDQELSYLGKKIADFNKRYEIISSNAYGAALARSTNDYDLLVEYGELLEDARKTKARIDSALSQYENFKQAVGLGVVWFIPVAVVTVLLATVGGTIVAMDLFMKKAGIEQIQADNPGMPYTEAAEKYEQAHESVFGRVLDVAQVGLWVAGAFLAWKVVQTFK